jgi:hypothetical protein
MPTRLRLLPVVVMFGSITAFAETVSLACEHRSGAFEGRVWSVIVDFDRQVVITNDYVNEERQSPATITQQYVMWNVRCTSTACTSDVRRIDRTTGVMYWNTNNTGWSTVFGTPGVVCQPKRAF